MTTGVEASASKIIFKPIIALLVVSCFSLLGFSQVGSSTLTGRVTDPGGLAVVGASVRVTNTETNAPAVTETNDVGLYTLHLAPGKYSVVVEREGFERAIRQNVELHVAGSISLDVSLVVGSVSQDVTVASEMPVVNTTESSLGGLVSEQKISELPLNGRNYLDLSLMQAGITQQKNSNHQGVTYSSNGAPFRSNNFTIDGASMNTLEGGGAISAAGTTLGVDGVREYKVITNNFSAEYGVTMGSQMVIVSKGGTNNFHGSGFEYLRNAALDARNYFDRGYLSGGPRLPKFQRNNFGGAFGGPIVKDKTFFWGVYEGLRQNLGFTAVNVVPPAGCHTANGIVNNSCISTLAPGQTLTVAPVMRPLLALFPSPNLANNQFTFDTSSKAQVDWAQMRVDHNFSDADTFFARYTIDNSTVDNANLSLVPAVTGTAFPQFRFVGGSRNQFVTLSETHVFSPTVLNTARLSLSRTNLIWEQTYSSPFDGPEYSFFGQGRPIGSIAIAGGFSAFGGTGGLNTRTQNIYTLNDDVFVSKGSHSLKLGASINRYNQGMNFPFQYNGTINFINLQSFLQGIPQRYGGQRPDAVPNYYYLYNTFGFYLQDDWRATSRLTLNLGLRYEFMSVPTDATGRSYNYRNPLTDSAPTPGPLVRNYTKKNFGPRVGFAYDVTGRGTTSIRGGFGIFYDVGGGNLGRLMIQNAGGTPPNSANISVTPSTATVLTLPLSFPQGINFVVTGDYNIEQPYVMQYNLSVGHQLPAGIGLTASYVGLRGIKQWTTREGNPVLPTATINGQPFWDASRATCANAAVPNNCRVNPRLPSNYFTTSDADIYYNSFQLNANKRLSRGLEFQVAYTWSKNIDTTQSNGGGSDCNTGNPLRLDPLNPLYDRGPACFDIPHNLRFNVLYHFPKMNTGGIIGKVMNGWWMGHIIAMQDGYPFSPMLATNRSRSGNTTGLSLVDRVDINRHTVAPGQTSPDGFVNSTTATFVPFDPETVYTKDSNQWINPYMFRMPSPGFLGNAGRNFLRGPGFATWDFSVAKDTALPFLGEQGSMQFRAEFFNLLNRTNFGMPANTIFAGSLTNASPYSERGAGISATNPLGNAGRITTTSGTSRQVQLSLRVVF